jgi:hypothetical protein
MERERRMKREREGRKINRVEDGGGRDKERTGGRERDGEKEREGE